MSTNKLSHSAATRFHDCAKSWELHYKQRIRPATKSSALLFGIALDVAFESYLRTKNRDEAWATLQSQWQKQEINGEVVQLFDSVDVVYSNSDYDKDLITVEGARLLTDYFTLNYNIPNWKEEYASIFKQKDMIGYNYLSKDRKKQFNAVNWVSMLEKGRLMLNKAFTILDQNLIELLDTQVKVSLKNADGDEIKGIADFVARWRGYDHPIVFDLKTSSIEYEADSVLKSPQLSLYVHDLSDKYNTRLAGYIVLRKRPLKNRVKICKVCGHDGTGKTHKTCPNEIEGKRCGGEWDEVLTLDIDYQIIINEVPQRTEDIVLENMDMVNESIKSGIFLRNFSACDKPWGPCAYKKYCFEGKQDGLIQLEKKNENE